ncbi:hypothetical protein DSECCO2_617840 [anaerobic digester metagenome]
MEHAALALAQKADQPFALVVQQRLGPARGLAGAGGHVHADDGKIQARVVEDGLVGHVPAAQGIKRQGGDAHALAGLGLGQPGHDGVHGMAFARRAAKGQVGVAAKPGHVFEDGRVGRFVGVGHGDERDHGARIHVDDVVARKQRLDLAEGQPAEVLVDRHLVVDRDHHVAVALAQKARALLGLELVQEHAGPARLGEVFEVARGLPAVDAGIVAARGLDRGRELEHVDVAGLHLGLHEEVEHAVDLPGEQAQDAHLGLVDDGLVPGGDGAAAGLHADAFDGEEFSGAVSQAQGILEIGPLVEGGQRHAPDREPVAAVLGREPVEHGVHVGEDAGKRAAGAGEGQAVPGRVHAAPAASR